MAISVLQAHYQTFNTASSPVNAVYTGNTTPGSVLIAAWAHEQAGTPTYSDGNGTYAVDLSLKYDAVGLGATTNLNIVRINNALATTSGCSFAFTGGGTASGIAMLFEVTGLASSPVDATSTNDSNDTAHASVSITPVAANDLIIAVLQSYSGFTPAADSGFTLFNATGASTGNFSAYGEYLVPGSATPYTLTFGSSTNQYFGAIAVAYQVPSGASASVAWLT